MGSVCLVVKKSETDDKVNKNKVKITHGKILAEKKLKNVTSKNSNDRF